MIASFECVRFRSKQTHRYNDIDGARCATRWKDAYNLPDATVLDAAFASTHLHSGPESPPKIRAVYGQIRASCNAPPSWKDALDLYLTGRFGFDGFVVPKETGRKSRKTSFSIWRSVQVNEVCQYFLQLLT